MTLLTICISNYMRKATKKKSVFHWICCYRYSLPWEMWSAEEAEGKEAVVELLWNFEFTWLRSGPQVNPCIRNQPTYITVCLPDIALIGGEGRSLKQKYRSYCYPGYNISPYNSCFVIEVRFWPGRVYNEPNLSSYSLRSLEHITGTEQKNMTVIKQLAGKALLVESSALAPHQTSTKVYREQVSSPFPTEHYIFSCGKELGGFIFCCNWKKTGYQDMPCTVNMIGIMV